jgi:hypothetical protein
MIIGWGERLVMGNTENYFWLRRGDLQNFKTHTADLSSECDIANAESHVDAGYLFLAVMVKHVNLRALDLPVPDKLGDRALFIP